MHCVGILGMTTILTQFATIVVHTNTICNKAWVPDLSSARITLLGLRMLTVIALPKDEIVFQVNFYQFGLQMLN